MRKSTATKPKRAHKIVIEGEQATRLEALAQKWGVTHTEALRRVLDQAFIGRGAAVAVEAGFILLENMIGLRKPLPKAEEKALEKKP
jgi:hypothetical protein